MRFVNKRSSEKSKRLFASKFLIKVAAHAETIHFMFYYIHILLRDSPIKSFASFFFYCVYCVCTTRILKCHGFLLLLVLARHKTKTKTTKKQTRNKYSTKIEATGFCYFIIKQAIVQCDVSVSGWPQIKTKQQDKTEFI